MAAFDWTDIPQFQPPDIGSWLTNAEEVEYNNYTTAYANQLNAYVAQKSNELNYQMMNEQNLWNLERRNEEWAYNDPSAQMDRMIRAGINPVIAVGQLENSPAQQLTSADWQGAEGFQAAQSPALHGSDMLQALLRSGDGLINSLKQGADSFIDARRQALAESMAPSQVGKLEADAAESRKRAEVYETVRDFNSQSLSDRLDIISSTLENLQKQLSKTDQDTKTGKALQDKYEAESNLAREQVGFYKTQLDQGFMRLSIMSRFASSSDVNAQTAYKDYQVRKQLADFQMKHQKVADLLDYLRTYAVDIRGMAKGSVKLGLPGNQVTMSAEGEARGKMADSVQAQAALDALYDRYIDDPTPENLKAFSEGVDLVQPVLDIQPPFLPSDNQRSPVSPQLMNPFGNFAQ